MLKSILISAVILLLLAGLTYSQDNFIDGVYESVTDEGTYNPPYNPDWMGTDIEVYGHSGSQTNVTHRSLDMEYCEENGRLYIASCVNISGWHGIRVWCSSNSGLTWTLVGAFLNNSVWWAGLSMKVEQAYGGRPDSVRVNVFYTYAPYSGGSNANLGFLSFKPHGGQTDLIVKVVATPTSGNKFAFPSAYSNGQFHSSSTDIGCIVGEYNNAGTVSVSFRKYYMINWSWNFSGVTYYPGPYFHPSADYKNNPTGTDSVYIAVERRYASYSRIYLFRTQAFGTGQISSVAVSPSPYTDYCRKPCLTIPQNRYPTRMAITYTRNTTSSAISGRGRMSYSFWGGFAWSNGYLGNSYTTRYTWVSSDTNGTSEYCTFIWGDSDSLNVRRTNVGGSGGGGTYYYDRASYNLTSAADPVCAVYNNSSGNHRRSTFTYWRYVNAIVGVKNIYFNAENLPTGITNTNSIANDYSLSQNFPNPFNPTTTIKFGIPKNGLVKLVVYDVLGKEVATLVNDEQTAGNYEVTFNASKLTTGVYFYKITSGDFSEVKKMMLVK